MAKFGMAGVPRLIALGLALIVCAASSAATPAAANREEGAAQFGQYCARCHGLQGKGNANRAIPALAGQRYAYLVRQIAAFSTEARDSATMHNVVSQQPLRDLQVRVNIAAYLSGLEPLASPATGDGTNVALGRGIFHEQCASCHRADARGSGAVPSLRNQHYTYLIVQLHKIGSGFRHDIDENIARFLRSLDDRDVNATADYLSRLRGPGKIRTEAHSGGAPAGAKAATEGGAAKQVDAAKE
jgi:cytochrome c553